MLPDPLMASNPRPYGECQYQALRLEVYVWGGGSTSAAFHKPLIVRESTSIGALERQGTDIGSRPHLLVTACG